MTTRFGYMLQKALQKGGAIALMLTAAFYLFSLSASYACGPSCDVCGIPNVHSEIRDVIDEEQDETIDHMEAEFEDHEEIFWLQMIWEEHLEPALQMMGEQLALPPMQQMFALGMMIDAKHMLETQLVKQKLTVRAHQDYHPSTGMCVIGTNVRSLAAAERNSEYTAYVLGRRSIDRQLGGVRSAAARGNFDNVCFRMRQFRARYCDLRDNSGGMDILCNRDGAATNILRAECLPAAGDIDRSAESVNRDINLAGIIDRAATLDMDFYDVGGRPPTDDERDIFALSNNLYSHNVMFRMPESRQEVRYNMDPLLDMRSIAAKRSVAEHSFNTIVGMRAPGTEESESTTTPYMRLFWEQLGVTDSDQLDQYLGDRPSYHAQMEVLTKKMFQNPAFFTNLYDEPVNVERKSVALQAIGLMQDFDMWQSYLRTEAMLSVMLELELLRRQRVVQDELGIVRASGIREN